MSIKNKLDLFKRAKHFEHDNFRLNIFFTIKQLQNCFENIVIL